MNNGIVPVATRYVGINSGFSMLHLTGWFGDKSTLSTGLLESNVLYPTRFLVFCSQFDKRFAPDGPDTCELLIFRRATKGRFCINLRVGDMDYMPDVIKGYVLRDILSVNISLTHIRFFQD
jgi:hypothetical protein